MKLVLLCNILIQKTRGNYPSYKYSTHSELLFPVCQVFHVAAICSMGNISAIRELVSRRVSADHKRLSWSPFSFDV